MPVANPVLDEHQRAYLERIVGANPRTPEEVERRRQAAQNEQLAREQAAIRWRRFIADSANVDKLIALVGQAPAAEPVDMTPPWLRSR